MPRWFFILASVLGLLAFASVILALPDPLGTITAKLTDGGLWTGLAAFLVLAVVLGFTRRGERGGPPPSGS